MDLGMALTSGYQLGVRGLLRGRYLPVLNQIWIFPVDVPEYRRYIFTHELFHQAFSLFMPSQMLPLRKALLGEDPLAEVQRFEDIVEAVRILHLPGLLGLDIGPEYLEGEREDYRKVAEELLHLGRRIAETGASNIPAPEALRLAIRALASVLLQIIPRRPRQGRSILKTLSALRPTSGWKEHLPLGNDLYLQTHQLLATKTPLPFDLAPFPDPHTSLSYAILYLGNALVASQKQPERLIGCLPGLVNVVAMGSMPVVPVVYLHKEPGTHYTAEIRMIHRNSEMEPMFRKVFRAQKNWQRLLHKRGGQCPTLDLFLSCCKVSNPFCHVTQDRYPQYVRTIVPHLGGLLQDLDLRKIDCPACRIHLFDPAVLGTIAAVRKNIVTLVDALGTAAENYEQWLFTTGIEWLQASMQTEEDRFQKPLRTVKKYRYI